LAFDNNAQGFLLIRVIGGRNLPALDSNGLSDPYLVITYKNFKFRTQVHYETLNPIWDEKFVITIGKSDSPDTPVVIWAFDRDEGKFDSDDEMGFLEFPIGKFLKTHEMAGWYKLRPPSSVGGNNLVVFNQKRKMEKKEEIEK